MTIRKTNMAPLSIKTALNLYAGIGGNRKNWPRSVKVTAVENNPAIAAIYKKYFPEDNVVITDAHQYLLENHKRFDFIWSSPPCLTHSRLTTTRELTFYPDLSLYQEYIFLNRVRYERPFVLENVKPYYKPLITPTATIGRHHYWSNFYLPSCDFASFPKNDSGSIEVEIKMMEWLGFKYNRADWQIDKRRIQLIRNAIHPNVGIYIYSITQTKIVNTNEKI